MVDWSKPNPLQIPNAPDIAGPLVAGARAQAEGMAQAGAAIGAGLEAAGKKQAADDLKKLGDELFTLANSGSEDDFTSIPSSVAQESAATTWFEARYGKGSLVAEPDLALGRITEYLREANPGLSEEELGTRAGELIAPVVSRIATPSTRARIAVLEHQIRQAGGDPKGILASAGLGTTMFRDNTEYGLHMENRGATITGIGASPPDAAEERVGGLGADIEAAIADIEGAIAAGGGGAAEAAATHHPDRPVPGATGYLGVLTGSEGSMMTELTIGVEIDGVETQIPTLIPGLTEEERAFLLDETTDVNDHPEIIRKAIAFAKKRKAMGLPYFFGGGPGTAGFLTSISGLSPESQSDILALSRMDASPTDIQILRAMNPEVDAHFRAIEANDAAAVVDARKRAEQQHFQADQDQAFALSREQGRGGVAGKIQEEIATAAERRQLERDDAEAAKRGELEIEEDFKVRTQDLADFHAERTAEAQASVEEKISKPRRDATSAAYDAAITAVSAEVDDLDLTKISEHPLYAAVQAKAEGIQNAIDAMPDGDQKTVLSKRMSALIGEMLSPAHIGVKVFNPDSETRRDHIAAIFTAAQGELTYEEARDFVDDAYRAKGAHPNVDEAAADVVEFYDKQVTSISADYRSGLEGGGGLRESPDARFAEAAHVCGGLHAAAAGFAES